MDGAGWRLGVVLGGSVAGTALLVGCIDAGQFTCSTDLQCASGEGGLCHESGACTYEDPECPSGRVWSDNAPGRGGECVAAEDEETSTSGSTSQTGSGTVSTTVPGTTSTSASTETEGDSTAPDAGSSGSAPACGDGALDDGEGCDDGNDVDGDGCNRDCEPSGRILWELEVEATAFDNHLDAVVVSGAGDIVAVGYAGTETAEDVFDSNQYDALVARIDADGSVAEVVVEARPGRDELRCVVERGNGEFWFGGERRTNDDEELWLGSLDGSALASELSYAATETRGTVGHACAVLPEGGLVVGGMLDGGEASGYSTWDRLLLYDPLGQGSAGSWTEHIPAPVPLRDIVYAITALPDGRVVAAGSTSINENEGSKRWVALFDTEGTMVWEYIDGGAGAGQEEVYGVYATDDRVYAVGVTLFNQGALERDWFGTIELETGALEYEEQQGLEAPAVLNGIAPAGEGDLFLIGRQGDAGEGVVVRFDPDAGDARWTTSVPQAVRLHGVAADGEGHAIIVGSTVDRGEDGPAYAGRLAP